MRLLVFMETPDYKGFHQVMLTEEQFKKVSDAIVTKVEKDPTLRPGFESAFFTVDEDRLIPSDVFDGMNSINQIAVV